jgi:deazaflavin-dependent oxidoreductase (nitroreductase family)
VAADLWCLANEDFCYLTTVGRVSGRPHVIEIWFAIEGRTLYMLSGGRDRSDWVKNLRRNPEVTVQIDGEHFDGRARVVEGEEEDALARRLLVEKYERSPGSLANWRRTALPVAVNLAVSDRDFSYGLTATRLSYERDQ